jgi:hypothetical protein
LCYAKSDFIREEVIFLLRRSERRWCRDFNDNSVSGYAVDVVASCRFVADECAFPALAGMQ